MVTITYTCDECDRRIQAQAHTIGPHSQIYIPEGWHVGTVEIVTQGGFKASETTLTCSRCVRRAHGKPPRES